MGGRESLFGAEFDSIADVVSFGMAPALLMIYLIISPTQAQDYQWFRNIGWFIAFVYLLCAAMRTSPMTCALSATHASLSMTGVSSSS